MTTRKPAIFGLPALLLKRFVPLIPPVAVGLHGGLFGFDARLVLALVIERAKRLPVRHRRVQGVESSLDLAYPLLVTQP